jgi:hypothetical protein
MAWQQSDLDAVDAAISSNVKRVTFADGRSREFHSPSEMLEVRNAIKAELLANASALRPKRRTTVAQIRR